MEVTDIKCNGVSWNSPAQTAVGQELLTLIKLFRMRHSEQEIYDKFPDEGWGYYWGSRASSDESILYRCCSAITSAAQKNKKWNPKGMSQDAQEALLEGVIGGWWKTLSAKDIDYIIQDAFRDCASADHWYMFEKDYS